MELEALDADNRLGRTDRPGICCDLGQRGGEIHILDVARWEIGIAGGDGRDRQPVICFRESPLAYKLLCRKG